MSQTRSLTFTGFFVFESPQWFSVQLLPNVHFVLDNNSIGCQSDSPEKSAPVSFDQRLENVQLSLHVVCLERVAHSQQSFSVQLLPNVHFVLGNDSIMCQSDSPEKSALVSFDQCLENFQLSLHVGCLERVVHARLQGTIDTFSDCGFGISLGGKITNTPLFEHGHGPKSVFTW